MERLRLRERLPFKPEWKGVEGLAVMYVRKALCRVWPLAEFDDLMQEARILFWQCSERYMVDDRKHFNALFMACLKNHVARLSNYRTRDGKVLGYGREDAELNLLCGRDNRDDMAAIDSADSIQHASKRVARVLNRLGIVDTHRKCLPTKRPWYRSANTWLCELAEVSSNIDMLGEIREWLTGEIESKKERVGTGQ